MAKNLVDNTTYGFTEGATKADAKSIPFITSDSSINANSKTTAGVYWQLIGGVGSNLPNSNSAGMLIVVRSTAGGLENDIAQFFLDTVNLRMYTRLYDSGSWSSWSVFGT